MFSLKDIIPPRCLRIIYFSLIQSYIQYCLPIFGATFDTHIEPLRILQKRAIRIINNASYHAHTDPLFFKSNILKIDDLYLHSIACHAFKNQDLLNNPYQKDFGLKKARPSMTQHASKEIISNNCVAPL